MIRIQQIRIEIPKNISKNEFSTYEKVSLEKKIRKMLRLSGNIVFSLKIAKRSFEMYLLSYITDKICYSRPRKRPPTCERIPRIARHPSWYWYEWHA